MWEKFPNLKRWAYELRGRPALERGYRAGRNLRVQEISEEQKKARQSVMFNQDSEKVRLAREAAARNDKT